MKAKKRRYPICLGARLQRAPAAEEALYIMGLSYDKLGLPELRDDAQRVLAKNFPESRYVKEGFIAPSKPWWQIW